MKSTWKKYLLYAVYILVGVGLLYGLLQIILAGYSVLWTGFGERTLSNGDIVGEKTLWDWMELLIIPLVLALGAFFLNRSERAVERETTEKRAELEREIAKDHQQDEALQTYLDRMTELLLKENLRNTENEDVRDVARTRTLTLLRGIDANRKRHVVQFLQEAGLIHKSDALVSLIGADLRNVNLKGADLREVDFRAVKLQFSNLITVNFMDANLQDANMQNANLFFARLFRANLEDADLRDSIFENANLEGANLKGADLQNANLKGAELGAADLERANLADANLEDADLRNAKLQDAYLQNANVSPEQLAQAKSLKGATMPDGTIHE